MINFFVFILGFDLENVDPKLKQFFSKAGVSERELQDKDTRDFIYDFIDKHGGIEAALLEVYCIFFIYILGKKSFILSFFVFWMMGELGVLLLRFTDLLGFEKPFPMLKQGI